MHKAESRSRIYLGNPRPYECGTVLLLQLFLFWLPHQVLTCFRPCMLLEFHSRGKFEGDLVTNRPQSLVCYWIKLFIFSTHSAFVMLELLFPCILLYSWVLIKIANFSRVSIRKQKTSASLEFFCFYYRTFKQEGRQRKTVACAHKHTVDWCIKIWPPCRWQV